MSNDLTRKLEHIAGDVGTIDGYTSSEYNNDTLKSELAQGTYDDDISDNKELVDILGDILSDGDVRRKEQDPLQWGIVTLDECSKNYLHSLNLEESIRTIQTVYERSLHNSSITSLMVHAISKKKLISADLLSFFRIFKHNMETGIKNPDDFVGIGFNPTTTDGSAHHVFTFEAVLADWYNTNLSVDDEIVVMTRLFGVKRTLTILSTLLSLLHA